MAGGMTSQPPPKSAVNFPDFGRIANTMMGGVTGEQYKHALEDERKETVTNKNWQGRQGDLLFFRLDMDIDEGKRRYSQDKPGPDGFYELAVGEKTGHRHIISGDTAVAQLGSNIYNFVIVDEETDVIHDEHHPLTLEPGVYQMVQQREFDYERFEETEGRRSSERARLD